MDLLNRLSPGKSAVQRKEERAAIPGDLNQKEPARVSKIKTEKISSERNIEPAASSNASEKQPVNTISKLASAADLARRKTEIIQSVAFKSDSLKISLYDNGEVDGDTVSVVLDNKVIIARQGLTTKAATITVYTGDLGDSVELVMYAENLGRIPPNTGLLILQDGDERYQIRFSGDLQNNSAITLRRKR
jgi:hypothetical protein